MNESLVVLWRIEMRINPLPNKHKAQDDAFLESLRNMISVKHLKVSEDGLVARWRVAAEEALNQSRAILKREWDVTKRLSPDWLLKTVERTGYQYRKKRP